MKKRIIILLTVLSSLSGFSQNQYVKWSYNINRDYDGSYIMTIKSDINENYYIYGMNIKEGPLPLEFSFENADKSIISYKFKEITKPQITFDEIFDTEVSTYSKHAEFECKFIPKPKLNSLKLIIDGQACNKKDGSCFPIREEIPINL